MVPASVSIGWLLADRALEPLLAITGAAQHIGRRHDLSGRIDTTGLPDEFRHLGDTLDAMLDRIHTDAEERWASVQDLVHELRNRLAVMATTLDVALDDGADLAELRRSAQVVRRTVDRAAGTVDDLIIVARNETPESRRTGVDLSGLLAEVIAEHQGPLGATRLTVERWGDPVVVTADRDAVKRALANVIGNAVRLSHHGSVLRTGSGSYQGFAWVGVDDQGPGIDPRQHADVFRRFWSSPDRASLGGEQHSGLGLAITRQIAEQHGGAVTLRSELGAGAEFVIWLPQSADAEVTDVTADGIHPLWSPMQDDDAGAGMADASVTGSFIPA
jgi:signal transduction histidine kinase